MGELIQKPDTNPIIVALLNLILLGGGGYLMMGQQRKGVISIVSFCLTIWFGIGILIPFVTAYDAYLLGQKLQSGDSIGENSNGMDFLNDIFKD
jgi:TM2 domain-containing membrane protein YozV